MPLALLALSCGSYSARFICHYWHQPDAAYKFEAQFVTLCFGMPGTNHRTQFAFPFQGFCPQSHVEDTPFLPNSSRCVKNDLFSAGPECVGEALALIPFISVLFQFGGDSAPRLFIAVLIVLVWAWSTAS